MNVRRKSIEAVLLLATEGLNGGPWSTCSQWVGRRSGGGVDDGIPKIIFGAARHCTAPGLKLLACGAGLPWNVVTADLTLRTHHPPPHSLTHASAVNTRLLDERLLLELWARPSPSLPLRPPHGSSPPPLPLILPLWTLLSGGET
ncbi:hypothetical protein BC567DRAFT_7516 [Phyllosticta citribraziliensis]